MKKIIGSIVIATLAFSTTSSCKSLGLTSTTAWATAIGCGAGFAIGAGVDEMSRKKEAQERKKDILAIFKKKKQHNQGKIVGLGVGCLAGLGTGIYLDLMHDDIEEKFGNKGISLEKVAGKDGETEELKVKMDGDISFETGSSTLKGIAEQNVNNLSDALKAYPETAVKIYGHTDGTGSRSVNERLSEDRAESVANVMTDKYDVSSGRIDEIRGMANDEPLPGTNKTGREPRNRRVEVRIIAD